MSAAAQKNFEPRPRVDYDKLFSLYKSAQEPTYTGSNLFDILRTPANVDNLTPTQPAELSSSHWKCCECDAVYAYLPTACLQPNQEQLRLLEEERLRAVEAVSGNAYTSDHFPATMTNRAFVCIIGRPCRCENFEAVDRAFSYQSY